MKARKELRRAAALTAACLLAAGGACAEETNTIRNIWESLGFGASPTETVTPEPTPAVTATPAPEDFRFRDGIRWGMTQEQVRALESENMVERSNQEWSVMVTTEKVAVSRFTADLVFMFRRNQLRMITYEFQRPDAEADFQYLAGALSSVYGEKQEADPSVVKTLMDAINPGRYQTEQMTQAYAWIRSDGTAVFLYFYGPGLFSVMYAAPDLGGGLYQTQGL